MAVEPARCGFARGAAAAGAARAAADSLESISTDIARLVDSDAAAELWERWRAGDVGAVSRRLYTVAGQQTFDDIRRRYRAESAFPRLGQPLCPGIRAAVDQDRPERPRRLAIAGSRCSRTRQGLHHARPRLGTPGLRGTGSSVAAGVSDPGLGGRKSADTLGNIQQPGSARPAMNHKSPNPLPSATKLSSSAEGLNASPIVAWKPRIAASTLSRPTVSAQNIGPPR